MPETESAALRDLLNESDSGEALSAFLVDRSGLPGPRANLGLARLLADLVAATDAREAHWALFRSWQEITAAEAPTGDPREFLPFCALQALGARHVGAEAAQRAEIALRLRQAASDERWRVRESAAIALQRIGQSDFAAIQALIDDWLPAASLFEQRAILAALAEPPLLRTPGAPAYALAVAGRLLQTVRGLTTAQRKREPFRVLRQALEYGLSVIVAALPEEGFAFMRAWATCDDRDIQRILRANLGKARLAKYEAEVRRVEESRSRQSSVVSRQSSVVSRQSSVVSRQS